MPARAAINTVILKTINLPFISMRSCSCSLGKFSLLYYGIIPKRNMLRTGLGIDMVAPIPGHFSMTSLQRDILPQGIKYLSVVTLGLRGVSWTQSETVRLLVKDGGKGGRQVELYSFSNPVIYFVKIHL
jgi:hypothetical protein